MRTFQTHDALNIRYDRYTCEASTCRGTVLLLGGRTEFIEKYWETVDDLLLRGMDVATFDWRGQGLSDRLLPNRFKGYVETYDDYLKDLTYFMDEYVLQDAVRPVVVLAHSMGGHIALRYLHDKPGRVDKAVLTAPLIDIAGPALLKQPMKLVVKLMAGMGLKTHYATRAMDFDPALKRFSGNRLTRDPSRYKQTIQKMVENPDVAIGGVTFGWLDATFESIQHVMADGYCESISTPTLIISAGDDEIVSLKAQQKVSQRMPNCRLVTISGALHELMIETDSVRQMIWKLFEGFALNPDDS